MKKFEYDNTAYRVNLAKKYVLEALCNSMHVKRATHDRREVILSCNNIFKNLIKFNEDIRFICFILNRHFKTDMDWIALSKCKTVDDICKFVVYSLDKPECVQRRRTMVIQGYIPKDDLLLAVY